MTRHYPDVGSASDWSCRVGNLIQPIRRTTQIWVVTRHQHGICALVSQTSFGGETGGNVAKCRLFSKAKFSVTCSFSASDGEVSQRFALVNRFPTSKWEEARQFLLGSSQ